MNSNEKKNITNELNDEELEQVSGGDGQPSCYKETIAATPGGSLWPVCQSCSWRKTCTCNP